MPAFLKNTLAATPNILTISRLVAAPLFFVASWEQRLGLFAWAVVSEFLDGFLARRFSLVSSFGQLMDPIADKAFMLSVITALILEQSMNVAQLVMIGYRDLTVICGALVVLAGGHRSQFSKMTPIWWGKVATFWQFVFLFSVLYLKKVVWQVLFLAFGVSFFSACMYVQHFFNCGTHLVPGEDPSSEVALVRRKQMLALVYIGMFFGLLAIYFAYD